MKEYAFPLSTPIFIQISTSFFNGLSDEGREKAGWENYWRMKRLDGGDRLEECDECVSDRTQWANKQMLKRTYFLLLVYIFFGCRTFVFLDMTTILRKKLARFTRMGMTY